jgi:signal peptidase I
MMVYRLSPQVKRITNGVVGLIIASVCFMVYAFTPVRVWGDSMNPTLSQGDILLMQRFHRLFNTTYARGQLVIFKPPLTMASGTPSYIKRLIALPGDSVSVIDNTVVLNGQRLTELYTSVSSLRKESFPKVMVYKGQVVAFEGYVLTELPEYLNDSLAMLAPLPQDITAQSYTSPVSYTAQLVLDKNFYFVLGDNREFSASEDSRLFGAIRASSIQGIARRF